PSPGLAGCGQGCWLCVRHRPLQFWRASLVTCISSHDRDGSWNRHRNTRQPRAQVTASDSQTRRIMRTLFKEIRHNPLLWLLVFVPVVFAAEKLKPEAHTLLFVLSVLAIVPLTMLLTHATESVATKTGDAVGGLLNATLGNL